MFFRTFVLKVINNDRKFLTDHEIVDHIAEEIESVITQMSAQRNFGFIRTYGGQVSHLFIHLSSLTFAL